MDRHKADCCKCHKYVQPAQQSLSDMDFDRGIWNAVIYNEVERVKDFIAKGKTMDRDNCDYTALHYAARNGNVEICKLLLQDGKADINAVTKGGATALHRAAMMGKCDNHPSSAFRLRLHIPLRNDRKKVFQKKTES
ncbi:ankyrin repeat domain-containing protein 39 [Lucilia cuprina]|uniref:ankyrin repeat domain-containing protein 39 n=1 Tax=Lucilia cuprina TaxID=7375 RepID=UPI001F05DA21|nr:ankyrin repeat domain-containing protein 39 [Lucilia cuprina]